jgi:ribonuclease R
MMASGSAAYQTLPGLHFGIGADEYGRFTAPMREVVGIYTHKETWERLGGASQPNADDEALRDLVLKAAARCRQIQRELDREVNRLVLDQMFADDLKTSDRPQRLGTVMGVQRNKLHVQLDDPPIDVKVYARHIERHMGTEVFATKDGASLRKKSNREVVVSVGDAVRVQVVDKDRERDRWELKVRAV